MQLVELNAVGLQLLHGVGAGVADLLLGVGLERALGRDERLLLRAEHARGPWPLSARVGSRGRSASGPAWGEGWGVHVAGSTLREGAAARARPMTVSEPPCLLVLFPYSCARS